VSTDIAAELRRGATLARGMIQQPAAERAAQFESLAGVFDRAANAVDELQTKPADKPRRYRGFHLRAQMKRRHRS
jgi:hypothetical protein